MGNLAEKGTMLFINVTKVCNVNCARCFIGEGARKNSKPLSTDMFRKFLDYEGFDRKDTKVIFEGGEPTVIGSRAFEELANTARSMLPNARLGMVTNLFKMPDWVPGFIKQNLDWCETTFAVGGKATWQGDEQRYIDRFIFNARRLARLGIDCPVNVEINRETYASGVDRLMHLVFQTEQKHWDFDLSVDFPSFYENPTYIGSYPVLPGSLGFDQAGKFLKEIYVKYWGTILDRGIVMDPLHSLTTGGEGKPFNVARDSEFVTLNPDGTVTTNPLYTDMRDTYIGDLKRQTVSEIMASDLRGTRKEYELKRKEECRSCEFFKSCAGGPSHVMVFDGSGECCGLKKIRTILSRSSK